MADDLMQRPQADSGQALPVHPVVTSGATQTNANTGGMVDRGVIGRYLPQGNLVEVGWPQPQNVVPPALGRAVAETGRLVGAGVNGFANAPPVSAATDGARHAAAAAMQYFVGHAEGVLKGANAAAVGAAPAPGEGANPDNRIGQEVMRPIEGDPRLGAAHPPAYGTPSGNFPGYAGDGVSISPGPIGYAGPVGGGGAAAPQPGHFLGNAAQSMGRNQFAQAFAGVPSFLVIEALQAMKTPSMDDQARAAAVDVARRSAATGNPQAQAYLRDLLEAEALGDIQPTFRGMHQNQQ